MNSIRTDSSGDRANRSVHKMSSRRSPGDRIGNGISRQLGSAVENTLKQPPVGDCIGHCQRSRPSPKPGEIRTIPFSSYRRQLARNIPEMPDTGSMVGFGGGGSGWGSGDFRPEAIGRRADREDGGCVGRPSRGIAEMGEGQIWRLGRVSRSMADVGGEFHFPAPPSRTDRDLQLP